MGETIKAMLMDEWNYSGYTETMGETIKAMLMDEWNY